MKFLHVLDLLKYTTVSIEAPNEKLNVGDFILLQTERDNIVAKVLSDTRELKNIKINEDYKFSRILNAEDLDKYQNLENKEKERIKIAKSIIEEMGMKMRIFASKNDFDGKVFSFLYMSDEKVDFRELLKRLPQKIGGRVHLQRVGVRDKAKILGGFGSCGREACCKSFMTDLPKVSLDSIRDQNIMLKNNTKIFGMCGKLKCCLLYEVPLYREMRKFLPHIKQTVTTNNGVQGKVVGLDILNQKIRVKLSDDIEQTFDLDELNITKNNKQ